MEKDYYDSKLERSGPIYGACFVSFIGMLIFLILLLLTGCKSKEFVPVVETHTEHHWHTDSVRQVDSIFQESTTLIREVDSATMAQYGIQLKNMERAWLIQNDKLQRELSKLQSVKTDTFIKIDSVPKIITKEVEKKISLKDRIQTFFGDVIIGLVIVGILIIGVRLFLRR